MNGFEALEARMRAADPAQRVDTDPSSPRARRIFVAATTRTTHEAPNGTALRRGRPRKRIVVFAVATLVLASSITAIASGVFEPDPADVATILDDADDLGRYEVKTDDWRPTLRSERVICAFEDGSLGATSVADAEELPLDAVVTDADLIAACMRGSDGTRHLDTPDEFTVCRGTIPTGDVASVLEAMEASGEMTVRHGSVGTDRPAFPVVLGWRTTCDQATVATSPERTELDAWTASDTESMNRSRQIEIGLMARSIDECLSRDAAAEFAVAAAEQLDGDWVVVDGPSSPDGTGCAQAVIDAVGRGVITIHGR